MTTAKLFPMPVLPWFGLCMLAAAPIVTGFGMAIEVVIKMFCETFGFSFGSQPLYPGTTFAVGMLAGTLGSLAFRFLTTRVRLY